MATDDNSHWYLNLLARDNVAHTYQGDGPTECVSQ